MKLEHVFFFGLGDFFGCRFYPQGFLGGLIVVLIRSSLCLGIWSTPPLHLLFKSTLTQALALHFYIEITHL